MEIDGYPINIELKGIKAAEVIDLLKALGFSQSGFCHKSNCYNLWKYYRSPAGDQLHLRIWERNGGCLISAHYEGGWLTKRHWDGGDYTKGAELATQYLSRIKDGLERFDVSISIKIIGI